MKRTQDVGSFSTCVRQPDKHDISQGSKDYYRIVRYAQKLMEVDPDDKFETEEFITVYSILIAKIVRSFVPPGDGQEKLLDGICENIRRMAQEEWVPLNQSVMSN